NGVDREVAEMGGRERRIKKRGKKGLEEVDWWRVKDFKLSSHDDYKCFRWWILNSSSEPTSKLATVINCLSCLLPPYIIPMQSDISFHSFYRYFLLPTNCVCSGSGAVSLAPLLHNTYPFPHRSNKVDYCVSNPP
ncbi:unnamed protein product, partial [Sphenostylis stenocarpa]